MRKNYRQRGFVLKESWNFFLLFWNSPFFNPYPFVKIGQKSRTLLKFSLKKQKFPMSVPGNESDTWAPFTFCHVSPHPTPDFHFHSRWTSFPLFSPAHPKKKNMSLLHLSLFLIPSNTLSSSVQSPPQYSSPPTQLGSPIPPPPPWIPGFPQFIKFLI